LVAWLAAGSAVVAMALVAVTAVASVGAQQVRQRGSVVLGGTPGNPVVNLKTHTLYMPLQVP
jgi:hypothetical protein